MCAVAVKKGFNAKKILLKNPWVWLILGLSFGVMLVFNWLTPLISDDYSYLLRFPTHEPVQSWGDIVVSQYHHYMQWGGRTIAIGLNQVFLFLPKLVFNLANAGVFCLLVWGCVKLATGHNDLPPLLLVAGLGLLFHFNPAFGGVNLWMCGSCVYLWPLCIGVCFLLPYRLELDGPWNCGRLAPVGMFLAGVAAGWGNENTSGAVLLAALVFLVLLRIFEHRTPLWAICGMAGSLAGFALLMLSPGQWLRFNLVNPDSRNPIIVLLSRLMNATHTLKSYGLWLLVGLGILYFVLCLTRPGVKALALPAVYFLLALAANYALVLSPVYYVRSFYPVLAFLVMAILSCLVSLSKALPPFTHLLTGALAGAMCVLLAFDLLAGGYDIVNYATMRAVREDLILKQAQQGETDITTYAIYPYTRFCGAYGQPDLRLDSKSWVNVNMSLHLGVDSLAVTEQHYYPFPGYDEFSNTTERELSYGLE